jgi:Bifunctional DNA primase/polymerase, N-terminal/Primase C terminal 2 (PriCT-2)
MTTSQTSELLDAALAYAGDGYPLFPCDQNKRPLTLRGFKDASTDERQIRAWWRNHPHAMIGMPTGPKSGIDVLDLDLKPEEYIDGREVIANWRELSPAIVQTPSGGLHLWFKSEGQLRNSADVIGPGVDTRGDGGYVIVPPSRNRIGAYKTLSTGDELPPFPPELLARLGAPRHERQASANPTATPADIRAAMRRIANPDLGWDGWQKFGLAVWRATGGSAEGFSIWDEWSRKSSKYEADNTRDEWDGIHRSPPTRIGAGTIFWHSAHQASTNEAEVPEDHAVQQRLDELAHLDAVTYDRQRHAVARELGIRTTTLDRQVAERRAQQQDDLMHERNREPQVNAEALAQSASVIIESEDVLTLFAAEFKKFYAGEENNAKLLYLICTSRLFPLKETMHAGVKGPSSVGKSAFMNAVAEFVPPESRYKFTALSEKALLWGDEGDLKHKVLIMAEASDDGQQQFQDMLLRELMSEGVLRYPVPVKGEDGEIRTVTRVIEGPVAFLVSTTRNQLDPQNETRVLSIELDDRPEQTKRVLLKIAEREGMNRAAPDIDFTPWHDFQRWIAAGERRVDVPYATALAELIPPKAVRLRRDFGQLLRAIKAYALLHRQHRAIARSTGAIIATFADYGAVRALITDLLAESAEVKLRRSIPETIAAVAALQGNDQQGGATVRGVAARLRLDMSATRRRLYAAEGEGHLENLETRKGRPAKYRVLPGSTTRSLRSEDVEEVLPTVERLREEVVRQAPHRHENGAATPLESRSRLHASRLSR